MTIKFGPSGLGSVKEAVENLEMFSEFGLQACEIAFTYGVYIKENETTEIRKAAEKFGIKLSIHAPYWINLNSEDKEKIEKSKERILACCRIGHLLGVEKIVFHPGYYGKISKEETYNNIREGILKIQLEIKRNKWDVKLAPETTGKVNVFGSVEEILSLVKDTGCAFTLDFAHVFARSNGKLSYNEIISDFIKLDDWHCHFSGIEYGEKGEKKHKMTSEKMWKELLRELPKGKNIVIINESPSPFEDSVLGLKVWRN
jgi:deoxyribonuclease IV